MIITSEKQSTLIEYFKDCSTDCYRVKKTGITIEELCSIKKELEDNNILTNQQKALSYDLLARAENNTQYFGKAVEFYLSWYEDPVSNNNGLNQWHYFILLRLNFLYEEYGIKNYRDKYQDITKKLKASVVARLKQSFIDEKNFPEIIAICQILLFIGYKDILLPLVQCVLQNDRIDLVYIEWLLYGKNEYIPMVYFSDENIIFLNELSSPEAHDVAKKLYIKKASDVGGYITSFFKKNSNLYCKLKEKVSELDILHRKEIIDHGCIPNLPERWKISNQEAELKLITSYADHIPCKNLYPLTPEVPEDIEKKFFEKLEKIQQQGGNLKSIMKCITEYLNEENHKEYLELTANTDDTLRLLTMGTVTQKSITGSMSNIDLHEKIYNDRLNALFERFFKITLEYFTFSEEAIKDFVVSTRNIRQEFYEFFIAIFCTIFNKNTSDIQKLINIDYMVLLIEPCLNSLNLSNNYEIKRKDDYVCLQPKCLPETLKSYINENNFVFKLLTEYRNKVCHTRDNDFSYLYLVLVSTIYVLWYCKKLD